MTSLYIYTAGVVSPLNLPILFSAQSSSVKMYMQDFVSKIHSVVKVLGSCDHVHLEVLSTGSALINTFPTSANYMVMLNDNYGVVQVTRIQQFQA